MSIADDCHAHASVDNYCKTSLHVWTEGSLCIHLVMPRDGADIKQADALNPNEIRSRPFVLRCRHSIFVEHVKALASNDGKVDFKVRSERCPCIDKRYYQLGSVCWYLPIRMQNVYMRYVRCVNRCIFKCALLNVVVRLTIEGGMKEVCPYRISTARLCEAQRKIT